MNSLKTIAAIVSFNLISGSALAYDSFQIDYERPAPAVSFANCAIGEEYGRTFYDLKLLDRSSDKIPAPREGASCAQYVADLTQFGANVDVQPVPCEALLSGTRRYKMCIFVIVAGL